MGDIYIYSKGSSYQGRGEPGSLLFWSFSHAWVVAKDMAALIMFLRAFFAGRAGNSTLSVDAKLAKTGDCDPLLLAGGGHKNERELSSSMTSRRLVEEIAGRHSIGITGNPEQKAQLMVYPEGMFSISELLK